MQRMTCKKAIVHDKLLYNKMQQFGVIDSFDNATYDMQEGLSAWQTIMQ